jgi:GDPmannose 4,6-dehydratase
VKKIALIIGITGQDGSLLAKLLLEKNYIVYGTSRNIKNLSSDNLIILNIIDKVTLVSLDPTNYEQVKKIIQDANPNEIYNLSGQTSVGNSFLEPFNTYVSIFNTTLNFLENIRLHNKKIKFYNPGSSECFGDCSLKPATEYSPFNPVSPYASAKVASHNLVQTYRENYNLFAATGFLFNHESPLRPDNFVIKKIIKSALEISKGEKEKLFLGNVKVIRDWGWAPDFVDAIWRMLQINSPEDFIISTGNTISLEEFINKIFLSLNLDYTNHVVISDDLIRSNELKITRGNPEKAKTMLDWSSKYTVEEIIIQMINFEKNGKFEL